MDARTHTFITKIREHAYDGQNGSAGYAFDRLARIQELADMLLAQDAESQLIKLPD